MKKLKGLIHGSCLEKTIENQRLYLQPAVMRHLLLMFEELIVMDLPTSVSNETRADVEFLESNKLIKLVDSVDFYGKILNRIQKEVDCSHFSVCLFASKEKK